MKRVADFDFGNLLARVASFAARRARWVVAAGVLVSLVAAVLALRLDPSAATSTLIDKNDAAYEATQDFHKQFGDDAIVVLAQGKKGEPHALGAMVLTQDLGRLLRLEGCLSGNLPKRAKPAAPACAELAKTKTIKVVYGPGTFINEAAGQISGEFQAEGNRRRIQADRAAIAARKVAAAQGLPPAEQERLAGEARQLVYLNFARDATRLALKYGLTSVPALNNPDFVLRLVFDASLGEGVPKPRFSYVFPSSNAALIQARLKPGLSEAEQRRTIELVREATGEPAFKLKFANYVVSGAPVITQGVESSLTAQLRVLGLVAIVLMALALLAVFKTRRRLLPLALALVGASLTFGAMSLFGVPLTIAAIAVLPVLIGLAVDYAIQFQARFDEQGGDPAEAAVGAARIGGPVIATAALASATGFAVLLLSPVPMMRSFGLMLVVGIALAFIVALTIGFSVLGGDLRFPWRRDRPDQSPPPAKGAFGGRSHLRLTRLPRRFADVCERWGKGIFNRAIRRPGKTLVIATVLAAVGWVAGTQIEVVSDLTRLVPANQREVKDLKALQNETGVSGDIEVIVRSDRLTSPSVVRWMADYQKRILGRHGYQDGRPCREAEICPALSLTNLFTSSGSSPKQIRALLDALPRYFSQAVISRDRKTANLAFGIRTMPLEQQHELVEDMRKQLHTPPGVDARVAGLPVLAADANANLSSSRWLVTLAGLVGVFAILLLVYRRLERALVPLIPVLLATGWSGLVLFMTGIPLNPMSATLGALVVAITTEFSVILSARYRRERDSGSDPDEALARSFERTGPAVLASGVTAIAGFAALIASDFPMLRDFGLATVIDLIVALAGVMIVLPAALLWSEQRSPLKLPWRGRTKAPEPAEAGEGG
jgi:hypothetical protein